MIMFLFLLSSFSNFFLHFCICLKRKTFRNCLCSSSCDSARRFRNIGASHIRDFGSCHNVKSLIPSENGFGHFKEQLKRQARVVVRKKLLVILCSAVRKLNKPSILSLLITNYSSIYSICLLYLSIYLTILLVVGVSYQRLPCLAEGYS